MGIVLVGNCLGGNSPSGELSAVWIVVVGNCLVGNCPGGNCPRGELSAVWIVLVGNCPAGNYLNRNCPQWELSGWGIVQVGNCPQWELSAIGIVRVAIVHDGNRPSTSTHIFLQSDLRNTKLDLCKMRKSTLSHISQDNSESLCFILPCNLLY